MINYAGDIYENDIHNILHYRNDYCLEILSGIFRKAQT